MQSKGSEYDIQEGQMGYNYQGDFPEKTKDMVEEHEVPFRIYRPLNTLWWKSENQANPDYVEKDTTYVECSAFTKGIINSNFKVFIKNSVEALN